MKHKIYFSLLTIILPFMFFLQMAVSAQQYEVRDTEIYTQPDLGLTVMKGVVDLPSGRSWQGDLWTRDGVLEQIAVIPLGEEPAPARARRMEQAHRNRMTMNGRSTLLNLWSIIYDYASKHDGIGPGTLEDLDQERSRYILDTLNKSPWNEDRDKDISGPFYFLIPGVPIPIKGNKQDPDDSIKPPIPVFLELRPYVDDGRHWVLMSDGKAERREVDQVLIDKYSLKVRPVVNEEIGVAAVPQVFPHGVFALKKKDGPGKIKLELKDSSSDDIARIVWNFEAASPGDKTVLEFWAQARAQAWLPYLTYADAPILRRWVYRNNSLYGGSAGGVWRSMANRRGNTSTLFGVLGGRAAIRETIQLQGLRGGHQSSRDEKTIPVSGIEGVKAQPLPFEEMLGSRRGGRLKLAESAPMDRFFIYFAQPSALQGFLDQGVDFIFRSGSLYQKRSIAYDLKERYYRRLGVSEGWIRKFLESGAVEELALVLPDLFLIDGTEVTAIARVPRIKKLAPLLKVLGIVDIKQGKVTAHRSDSGVESFWTRKGDLVFVGTYRPEFDRIIELAGNGGEGSLGRSAEFRYMLDKLPLTEKTRAYAYLSDPFIRRLTGPEVKIGQLRRLSSRGTLESITAGALLRKLDGGEDFKDLNALTEMNYVPPLVPRDEYSLDDDLVARSAAYGTAADLSSLIRNPVDMVTGEEAKAYKGYVDNYDRFWRQYFDPIAVRLDDVPGGALEMSTFILPLVNSSIYNALRERLAASDGKPLDVPLHSPDAVVKVSLNLAEDQWVKISESFSRMFTRYTSIDPAIFDLLGPGLHLSILDGDPIIALGSGDVMGAFGGLMTSGRGIGFSLPILFTALTRPSRIFVELTDMEAALDILRKAAMQGKANSLRRRGGSRIEFRQVGEKDSWIYTFSLEGIISFRMGIELSDGFLIISNLPWSNQVDIKGHDQLPLGGAAMSVNVSAINEQLASLFTSAGESYQQASLQGMGYLYPLLLTGTPTVEEAVDSNNRLLGFRPLHVGDGQWKWNDGVLESTSFGTPTMWKLPPYREGDRSFGLLQGIEKIKVNMQLEDDGLRATCRWVWKE